MTADAKPCDFEVKNGAVKRGNGCLRTSTSDYKSNSEDNPNRFTFIQIAFVNIEGKAKGTYYDRGSMNVTINDWTGSVTYRGAEFGPEYVLKSEADSAEGTINYQASND